MLKKACDDFVMWWYMYFYLKGFKMEEFHFRIHFCFFQMPHFSHFNWKCLNWDTSYILNIKKWSIRNKNHKIFFKEPKLKLFDFGAFPIKILMPSHDKIILHMLFCGISKYLPYMIYPILPEHSSPV